MAGAEDGSREALCFEEPVGGSERAPQDVLLWYADYLELKAVLASGSREAPAPSFSHLGLESGAFLPIRDDQRELLRTPLEGRTDFYVLNVCSSCFVMALRSLQGAFPHPPLGMAPIPFCL